MAKRRRGYLKYYSGSMTGDSFQQCISDNRPKAILIYLYILESINAQDHDDTLEGKCTVDIEMMRRIFRMNTPTLLEHCSYIVATLSALSFEKVGTKLQFYCANYAEYQERRGQKHDKNDVKNTPNKEVRIKNKEKRIKNNTNTCAVVETTSAVAKINVVSKYCDLYKEKYGANPPILGKDAGMLNSVVKSLGLPQTVRLLEAYFEMPDSWAVARGHSLDVFIAKRNEVARYIATGSVVTRHEAINADKAVSVRKKNFVDEQEMMNDARAAGFFDNNKQIKGDTI